MKKVLAIAFASGLLLANCSKKTENNLKETNVMLEEPEVTVVATDSTAMAPTTVTPVAPVNPSPSTDSTTTAK